MALFLTFPHCQAAGKWPKTIITTERVVIRIYKPELLDYTDSTVGSRSVISVMDREGDDPIFGTIWTTAWVTWDTAKKLATIRSLHVDEMILPDDTLRDDIRYLTRVIEFRIPMIMSYSPVSLGTPLAERREQDIPYTEKDTPTPVTPPALATPPVIYYRTRPTALVLIDGAPRLKRNERWGVDVVENSAFVIIKDSDDKFYLYGGGHWYSAPTTTGPFTYTHDAVSRPLRKIARSFEKAARKDGVGIPPSDAAPVYDILVSTVPAIIIQSTGDPQPARIPGTALVYIQNSPNDVFFDTAAYVYYVQADGSWYRSSVLKDSGEWQPIQPQDLPADFAKIPATSAKADVLTNIPGTAAAAEMQKEEHVPAVQKVGRDATTKVEYDGAPRFTPIAGTTLKYATNTCAIVLLQDGLYYTVDDGIWFVAGTPLGVWQVSNKRPSDLDLIPRGHPAYRSRFVYIYRTTPYFVWDGYLPGYLDDPSGGCGLAEMEEYDPLDDGWCFDLDFVFGWGGGWYDGYYWLDRHHRYYGWGGIGGKWAHWHYRRGRGAYRWHGGAWAARGQWRPRRTGAPGMAAHAMPRRVNTLAMPAVVTRRNTFGSGGSAYTYRTNGGGNSTASPRGGYGGSGSRGGGNSGGGSSVSHGGPGGGGFHSNGGSSVSHSGGGGFTGGGHASGGSSGGHTSGGGSSGGSHY
jgi:hypothetical protein